MRKLFKCNANTDNFVGFKVKLYPTDNQKEILNANFGFYRFVYNWTIDAIQSRYDQTGKFSSYIDLSRIFQDYRKQPGNEWMMKFPINTARVTIRSAIKAFQYFFNKRNNFPKYKSKRKSKMIFGVRGERVVFYNDGYVSIEGLGPNNRILYKSIGQDINFDAKIYNVWISFDKDNYWISFQKEINRKHVIDSDKSDSIGIDVGLKHLATLSNGKVYDAPDSVFYTRRIKRLNRKVSKQYEIMIKKSQQTRTKFEDLPKSSNLLKIEKKLRAAKRHLSNKQNTFLHTITKEIVETNPKSIVIEDVKPQRWVHSNINGKKFSNSDIAGKVYSLGIAKFFHYLDYKSKERGIEIVKADRLFASSQICSSCGAINKPNRNRKYICSCCGLEIDRDLNAAINLSKLA